jgi:hypothetical protein
MPPRLERLAPLRMKPNPAAVLADEAHALGHCRQTFAVLACDRASFVVASATDVAGVTVCEAGRTESSHSLGDAQLDALLVAEIVRVPRHGAAPVATMR